MFWNQFGYQGILLGLCALQVISVMKIGNGFMPIGKMIHLGDMTPIAQVKVQLRLLLLRTGKVSLIRS